MLVVHPRLFFGTLLRRRATVGALVAGLVGCALPEPAPPAPPSVAAQPAEPIAPAPAPPSLSPVPPAARLIEPPPASAEPALRIRPERSPLDASGPPALRLPPQPEAPPAVLLASGTASWYADSLHGRRTANGERYDREEYTAAHRNLPFGSRLCVRSLVNGRTVIVRVNDRGPFTPGRIIDLSRAAAEELAMTGLGIKSVELWQLGPEDEACPDSLEAPVEGAGLGLDAGAAAKALQQRPAARKAPAPRRKVAPRKRR